MKKFLFLLLGFIISQVVFSQTDSHLKFRDIPINGHISDFVDSLKHKGFVKNKSENNIVIMNGSFVGKEVELFIIATPKTKQVWKVTVYLPKDDSWYSLKSDYTKYVKSFKNKYGNPSDNYEFFSSPYYEGDGYEMTALKSGKCHYVSFFNIEEGNVSVEISKFAQIKFSYEDSKNTKLKKEEEESSVLEDI